MAFFLRFGAASVFVQKAVYALAAVLRLQRVLAVEVVARVESVNMGFGEDADQLGSVSRKSAAGKLAPRLVLLVSDFASCAEQRLLLRGIPVDA